MNEQPTPLVQFAQVLEKAPAYLLSLVVGILGAILSDSITTSLAVGSVALGFVTGVWVALSAFFLLYAVVRTVNTIAQAIGMSGQSMSQALNAPKFPMTLPTHAQMGAGPQGASES